MLAHWWQALNDPVLDRLEERALLHGPDVGVVQARLRQARAGVRQEKADTTPKAGMSALYLHGDLPPTNTGSGQSGRKALDFYNAGFDTSWEIDLFGAHRRSIEAAKANAQAAQARVADAQVSLTAEVARNYIQLRDRQLRQTIARQDIELAQRALNYGQLRRNAGTATDLDLVQLQRQMAETEAALITLRQDEAVLLDAISALLGVAPGDLDSELAKADQLPMPPAEVRIEDPTALLSRRPDIRAAERTLAAQTAKIGVAQASRFPKISLMGVIGMGGSNAADVFNPSDLSALALPRMSWNFLDFGRGAARVEQARASQDEAAAQYRASVVTALRDAEDSLARFAAGRATLAFSLQQNKLAQQALSITAARRQGGTARIMDEVDAQRRQIAAQNALIQAQSATALSFVALQKSFGLGWQ